MILAVTDVVWTGIIGGVVALGLGYMQMRTASKIDKIARVSESTHILVNSNMGIQLRINAVATRRLALMTGEKDDTEAANLAERLYLEHQTKQAIVDSSKLVPFQEVPLKQPKTNPTDNPKT